MHYYKLISCWHRESDWNFKETIKNIDFKKIDTTRESKKFDDNYNMVGPYKMENNYSGTVKIEVRGTILNGSEQNLTDFTVVDINGNELSKTLSDNSTTEFYLKVPKNVVLITNVKVSLEVEGASNYERGMEIVALYQAYDATCGKTYKTQCMGLKISDSDENPFPVEKEIEWTDDLRVYGDMKIVKIDWDTEERIPNVVFEITGDNLNVVKQLQTKENGEADLTDELLPGKYNVREVAILNNDYNLSLQTDSYKEGVEIKNGETTTVSFRNRKYGNLIIKKVDQDTQNTNLEDIKFKGVKFRVSYTDKNGRTQYITSYTYGTPSVLGISENQNNAYLFETDENGTVRLDNIPQYYKYHIEEVDLPGEMNQYYDARGDVLDVSLYNNIEKDTEFNVNNKQQRVDLEGYVWEDKFVEHKISSRNNEWDEDNTDFRVPGIKVYLKKNGQTIAIRKTDSNGAYFFPAKGDYEIDDNNYGTYDYTININEASQYSVEFEYNGLKYQSVLTEKEKYGSYCYDQNNKQDINTSKVAETRRDIVNENFFSISGKGMKNNGRTTGKTSTEVELTYTGDDDNSKSLLVDNTSHTLESLNGSVSDIEAAKMLADTKTAGYEVQWKAGRRSVKNINLGIYLREQPDNAIVTDLDNVELTINNTSHIYNYKQREAYLQYQNNAYDALMDGFTVSVKRNGEYNTMSYIRTIYDEDIAYTVAGNENALRVYTTYKLTVKNESNSLVEKVALRNYADSNLNFISAKVENGEDIKFEEKAEDITNETKTWETGIIDKEIGPGESITIVLKYELKRDKVLDMANLSNYDAEMILRNNTTEIISYETRDQNKNVYAGIDSDSAPGNIIYKKLDTYEDDTDTAPTLKFKRKASKMIEGKVFEDKVKDGSYHRNDVIAGSERIGDGKYDGDENGVENVKVELLSYDDTSGNPVKLWTLDNNGKFKESPAVAYTKDNGDYEFEGIVPGRYYLKYTYGKFKDGNESHQTTITEDGTVINVTTESYKSTIVNKNMFSILLDDINAKIKNLSKEPNNEITRDNLWYWFDHITKSKYAGNENRSSATDNYEQREKINKHLERVNYNTKTKYEEGKNNDESDYFINAYSGIMNFAIEDEDKQESQYKNEGYNDELKHHYKVKFGIIERPRQNLSVYKEIDRMSLLLANGQVLAQGDPRPGGIDYVTYPDGGRLKIEVDSELLEGSNLELNYNILVTNKSELDYDDEDYYKYGTASNQNNLVKLKCTISDYGDEKLSFTYGIDKNDPIKYYTNKDDLGKVWNLITSLDDSNDELAGVPISPNVYTNIKNRTNILVRDELEAISPNDDPIPISLTARKLLSNLVGTDQTFNNFVEIIQVVSPVGRFYVSEDGKTNTPGNFDPTDLNLDQSNEDDNNNYIRAQTAIVPPTGENRNIAIYVAIGFGSLLILAGGIILIKKIVLK